MKCFTQYLDVKPTEHTVESVATTGIFFSPKDLITPRALIELAFVTTTFSM